MLFAVSGVILISIFSEEDQSKTETITETPAGYIVSGKIHVARERKRERKKERERQS